jgi:hypothetical protein
MPNGVGVCEGKTINAGRVGGGNGLRAETGLAKIKIRIMPTPHNPIKLRMENTSQIEKVEAFAWSVIISPERFLR